MTWMVLNSHIANLHELLNPESNLGKNVPKNDLRFASSDF